MRYAIKILAKTNRAGYATLALGRGGVCHQVSVACLAEAQGGEPKPPSTANARAETLSASLKQIDAGVLNVGYAE